MLAAVLPQDSANAFVTSHVGQFLPAAAAARTVAEEWPALARTW
jgi:hypothetical protein